MANNNSIQVDIGLHYAGRVYDLSIPKMVTLRQLERLLKENLPVAGVDLPEKFQLEIVNKPIKVDQDVVLVNYPIGNGDQFRIIEEEG